MNNDADTLPSSRLNRLAAKAKRHGRQIARGKRTLTLPTVEKVCEDQNMAKPGILVWGPYRDSPTKYRLKLCEGTKIKSLSFQTEAEALAIKQSLLADVQTHYKRRVRDLIEDYRQEMLTIRGAKPQTAKDVCALLCRFLPLGMPVLSFTAEKAESLYRDYAAEPNQRNGKPRSTATHQHALILAKSLFRWAAKRGHVKRNPFEGVTPIGKQSAGKVQLRIDEAQRFEATALEMGHAGDAGAVGVLHLLHLGLRQGEAGARVPRDVDNNGRTLIIPCGKTKNATRRLKVPEHLQPLLLKLAQRGKPYLFHDADRPPHQQYFWSKVRTICKRAGVPIVCPHSLRGLHATLSLEEGATSDMVARALGHGSFEMTARHYATPESVSNARSARVTQALSGAPDMLV